jgi:choloylglycine hydrolase
MNRKAILVALLTCLLLALALMSVTGASPDGWRTLLSLRKVDDHPLYVMNYYGDYALPSTGTAVRRPLANVATEPAWACTCFAALADAQAGLFGRNFDWYDHPALLLFTAPPGRYASVSMVDISYLGLGRETPSWAARRRLLAAPRLPFDGMNERGLVVGMMAVPQAEAPFEAEREIVDSLVLIRLLLDYAGNVEEALAIFTQCNIDWGGGPPLHYLVADAKGQSAVVEFVGGDMRVLRNLQPWQVATNFVLSEAQPQGADSECWRYNRAYQVLQGSGGYLSMGEAMSLLQSVSQANTVWSTVYGIGEDQVQVAMGGAYDRVYSFPFEVRP